MIKFENTDVSGWDAAIRGMRNPMNSWDKSDTGWIDDDLESKHEYIEYSFDDLMMKVIGNNDLQLMKKLIKAGSDHRKFMRFINVAVDVTAPLYWWKEYDTYKISTVSNSCSTMHKIHEKPFHVDDFSVEHLLSMDSGTWEDYVPFRVVLNVIGCLNWYRELYIKTKDKTYWWQMIQLLPTSYNQKRTLQLNYEVLRNMYHARKNHKLDEWHHFCEWIETLPYSELITMQ